MTKTILLGISGSISAYKAADLTSKLTKKGYTVHVIMTEAARQFITPLTLQVLSKQAVHLDIMQEKDPAYIAHIELAQKADAFVVAPASANTVAKLAHGLADNMLTTTALAIPDRTPKFVAPAMNTIMYQQAITQANLNQLKQQGYQEIVPKSSLLACGIEGIGALADLDTIINCLEEHLT